MIGQRRVDHASDIGFSFFSTNGPVIIRIPSAMNVRVYGFGYTINNLAESTTQAKNDDSYFRQLVNDAVWELKHGREYYCFTVDHIVAIRALLPLAYQIEVLTEDGSYRLYAHRGN